MTTFMLLIDLAEDDPDTCDKIAKEFVEVFEQAADLEMSFQGSEESAEAFNVRCTWV